MNFLLDLELPETGLISIKKDNLVFSERLFQHYLANLKGISSNIIEDGIMTLSESELLVRIADHVAKLSDIVTRQSKTILVLDTRINDLENRLKRFEKSGGKQHIIKKLKK
jgi:hypothetical protein